MIISLENISKIYNGNSVLSNVSLTVEDNDRIGLIGINGSGKSTLLRIITGQENPETQSFPNEPAIYKNKDARIGFLEQNSGLERESSVIDEMKSVFSLLDETAGRLRELESLMADVKDHESAIYRNLSEEYSLKTAWFESNDGYLTDVKIGKVLNGMGFPPDTYGRIISTLSGGEKTRLALAKLLLENLNLLILDEPTNHLDFNTVVWLEDYLKDYKGALLIVSHDRYFLDKLCTSVCEIERGSILRFKGNYSRFAEQKASFNDRKLKEYEAQQAEIAKLEDYVVRNITRASTSNMAKSRMKKLEAMERAEKPVSYEKSAKIKFEYSVIPPLDILTVKDIDITVGEGENAVTLVESLSFSVRRGDKIGIVGSNGIGKSTLLKVIQKILPFSKGSVEWAKNVKISYFDQENAQLDMNDTVINAVHKKHRTMREGEIRSLLGSVRLTGENVFKQVGVISGGERAKLCFALMMLEHGNVLILDEPTNHLDISAREVIEKALCEFDGTVIFVSHDRYLLNRLGARILEITENSAESFNGGFEAYMEAKRAFRISGEEKERADSGGREKEKSESGRNIKSYRSKEQRADDAKRRLRAKELEAEIELTESEVGRLEEEISSPEICADYLLLNQKCGELEEAKTKLNILTDEWLTIGGD